MTDHQTTPAVMWVPATIGVLLWGAATALLLEEAWHAQRFDVATLSVPVVTAATVAAAVRAHHAFVSWRLLSAAAFAMLALLGSIIMASGTLGRLAEAQDGKQATVGAVNRGYGMKTEELKIARGDAARECKSGVSTKCMNANGRVDALTKELSGIVVRSTDPKADSIARLAALIGFDGKYVREIVQAFDPVTLPLFLEFGSVLFFAGAFPHRRAATVHKAETVSDRLPDLPSETRKSLSQREALSDFRSLKQTGSQKFLADRWQVSEGCVSKWLSAWEVSGNAERRRVGKSNQLAAIPQRRALPAPVDRQRLA